MAADAVAERLDATPATGLSEADAAARLRRFGPNKLRSVPAVPWTHLLGAQFKNVVVGLLLVATIVAFSMGDVLEGVSILVVIALNAAIGFITELRANRAMEALQKLSAAEAVVLRDGERRTVPSTQVVPGDVLVLQEGEAIPADGRVVESAELRVDEASLTGESLPVGKVGDVVVDEKAALADRVNMVYKGTYVAAGNGAVLVTATGMATEIGHISDLVSAVQDEDTPLEKKLAQLGRRLIVICLAVAALVALAGILQGADALQMIEAAIALAVAAVPEGLPAVATITLAIGMQKMAKQNALIRRLPAVETLGSTTCVCTDKTGTLTCGEMTVVRAGVPGCDAVISGTGYGPEGEWTCEDGGHDIVAHTQMRALVTVSALCNNASVFKNEEGVWTATGDPTEAALTVAADKATLGADAMRAQHVELKEFAFTSSSMMMATVNDGLSADMTPGDGKAVSVKGAPGVVLEQCSHVMKPQGVQPMTDEDRSAAINANEALAAEGLRILGLACKPVETVPESPEDAYSDLVWIGIVGMMDPPRDEVRDTVDVLTRAGIKTVMITGDQPATAARIAASLHIAPEGGPVLTGRDLLELDQAALIERLDDVEVFARVSPEQKVDICTALQARGEVVAMLGDGVNDAVALKGADIGVAMGIKGTDVAKETADMLLLDDRFATVATAMHQGRVIYSNIQKFIHYLFSCNLAEIGVMLAGSLLAAVLGEKAMLLPLLPLQILWLNIVTDVFPALALAMEPAEPDVMDRPPLDPDVGLLSRRTVRSIFGFGALMMLATMAAFLIGHYRHVAPVEGEASMAVTMSFTTLAFAQLFHVFNSRRERRPLEGREWLSNPWVLGAFVLTISLQLAAIYAPGLREILKTAPLGLAEWKVVLGCALMPLVIGQVWRWFACRGEEQMPGASP
jgi:P-type Ca2+ transporter type 2C